MIILPQMAFANLLIYLLIQFQKYVFFFGSVSSSAAFLLTATAVAHPV